MHCSRAGACVAASSSEVFSLIVGRRLWLREVAWNIGFRRGTSMSESPPREEGKMASEKLRRLAAACSSGSRFRSQSRPGMAEAEMAGGVEWTDLPF